MTINIRELVMPVVAGFVLTLFLNWMVGYLTKENGRVITSEPLVNSEKYDVFVRIENYTSKPLTEIQFIISGNASEIEITGYPPLEIQTSQAQSNTTETVYVVKAVSGGTRGTIKVSTKQPDMHIRVVNAEDLGLAVEYEGFVAESKSSRTFKYALVSSVVYLVILLSINYWAMGRVASAKEKTNELNARLDKIERLDIERKKEIEKKQEDIEKKLTSASTANLKLRILWKSRVRDLQLENNFYRSLIGNIAKESKVDGDHLKKEVTDTLKTFKAMDQNNLSMEDVVKLVMYEDLNKGRRP
jgi:hypothetical protein